MRYWLSALLIFLSTSLAAQSPTSTSTDSTSVQRDATAIGFVEASLNAMGGGAIPQVTSGTLSLSLTSQRKDWPDGKEKIEFSGRQYRDELLSASTDAVSVTSDSGGHVIAGTTTSAVRAHVADARFIPTLAALELYRRYRDANFSFTVVGTAIVNGEPAVKIRTRLERDELSQAGTVQTWFIDANTGLPLRVEYRFPQNNNGLVTVETAVEFGDWRNVSGVLVPFQASSWLDDEPWNRSRIDAISFNVAINPADFVVSGGAQ